MERREEKSELQPEKMAGTAKKLEQHCSIWKDMQTEAPTEVQSRKSFRSCVQEKSYSQVTQKSEREGSGEQSHGYATSVGGSSNKRKSRARNLGK